MRIINIVKFSILTVDRQCILCQVIRTDTEEINLFRKKITDHNSSRSLDHNTLLHIILKRNSLLCQLLLHLCNDRLDLLHLCHRNDHRIHNGNISKHTCSEQRTKLSLKHLRSVQTDTDRTITHSRVLLMCHIKIINLLVSTDIQCTDDHLLTSHILCYCLINLELLFLCRIIILLQINKLTSEKTDTLCIICQNTRHITCTSDICIQMNLMTALCLSCLTL